MYCCMCYFLNVFVIKVTTETEHSRDICSDVSDSHKELLHILKDGKLGLDFHKHCVKDKNLLSTCHNSCSGV